MISNQTLLVLLNILMAVGLLLVFIEDLRTRTISLFTLIIILLLATLNRVFTGIHYQTMVMETVMNLLFLAVELCVILLYLKIRHGKGWRSLDQYLGAGDIWFWLVITPFFAFTDFLQVFVGSLVVALILHASLFRLKKYDRSRIPLAGFQSIYILFFMGLKWIEFP